MQLLTDDQIWIDFAIKILGYLEENPAPLALERLKIMYMGLSRSDIQETIYDFCQEHNITLDHIFDLEKHQVTFFKQNQEIAMSINQDFTTALAHCTLIANDL